MQEANTEFYSKIESYSNKTYCTDSVEIANNIRSVLTVGVTPRETLINLLSGILSQESIERQLLTYEFEHVGYDTKFSTISQLLKHTHGILKRYQGIVGGFDLEDADWCEDQDLEKFNISEGKYIMYNTVDINLKDCNDINIFMEGIVRHISNSNANSNIHISYHICDDVTADVSWVIIVFSQ